MKQNKQTRDTRLTVSREAYNTFYEATVGPAIGISHESREYDRLGFVDIANLIQDRKMREAYCEKAIEMLRANIDVFRLDDIPVAPRHARVVCFTLLAPAAALYLSYPMWLALVAASFTYYAADVAYRDDLYRHKRLQEDWEENYPPAIATYEKRIDELDGIRWKSTLVPLNQMKA